MSEANTIRGWRGLARLDWRKRTAVTLQYLHGAHPHVLVVARGREYRYDWDVPILEVLRDVTNRNSW